MYYSIVGDGSYKNTYIRENGIQIEYRMLTIYISPDRERGKVMVDGCSGEIDFVVLKGIYSLIGDGSFTGTSFYSNDAALRGLQSLIVHIVKDQHPRFSMRGIFLPNIVEVENESVC